MRQPCGWLRLRPRRPAPRPPSRQISRCRKICSGNRRRSRIRPPITKPISTPFPAASMRRSPRTASPPSAPPPPRFSPAALKAEIGTVETEQGLNLGPPARMEIQQRLSALGLYSGPIDGDLGPGARSAIAEWQKRHDTAPTGQLGPLQLAQLRIESEGPYEQMMASRPPMVAPLYAPVRVYHAYRPVEHSYAAPAVMGLLGGLAIGILGAKLGGKFGGKGGGKKHR